MSARHDPKHDSKRDPERDPIDDLLFEANAAVRPPADLVDRIEARARRAGARPRVTARLAPALAAAAAIGLAALAWVSQILVPRPSSAPPPAPPAPPMPPIARAEPARVNVTGNFLATTVETDHPDVTIVLVYPSSPAISPGISPAVQWSPP